MGLERNYKEIPLPDSQVMVTVRVLKKLDYTFCGAAPDTLMPTFLKMAGKKEVGVQDMDAATAEYIVACVMRGIVRHPEKWEIVEKQPKDCIDNPTEFSFYDLSNNDQAVLTDAVFSGGDGIPVKFLDALGERLREEQERETAGQESSKG